MGTIHDDATDEAIDCTAQGATCGQAGGNSGYSDNLDCQKIIVAPAGSTIELLFSSIALEQDYDFVTVYDGGDINAPVLGRFTGTDLPNRLLSTGAYIRLSFLHLCARPCSSPSFPRQRHWACRPGDLLPMVPVDGNDNSRLSTICRNC